MGVQGFGLRAQGGLTVCLWCRDWGLGCRVRVSGMRVEGVGFGDLPKTLNPKP